MMSTSSDTQRPPKSASVSVLQKTDSVDREHNHEDTDSVKLESPAPRSSVTSSAKKPFLLETRSSVWFVGLTVSMGIMTDLAVYGLIVPVVPFRLTELGYTDVASLTGWLIAAYALGLVISSPIVAFIGEKVSGRRTPLLLVTLAMVGSIIFFMLVKTFALLLVARILQGFSGTGIWTLGLSLLGDTVDQAFIGSVMGYVMIGYSLGTLIGPPVGGALYYRFGYNSPFYFAIALLAVDILMRVLVIERHVANRYGHFPRWARRETSTSSTISAWAGVRAMVKTPRFLVLFAVTVINGVCFTALLDSSFTLYVNHKYGLTSLGAGVLLIAAVTPSFVASPLAGLISDRYGPRWIGGLACILSVPAFLLFIIPVPLAVLCVFLVVLGFILGLYLPPLMSDLNAGATSIGLGYAHVYGAFNLSFSIGAFLGPIISGQTLEAIGISGGWKVVCGTCAALCGAAAPFWLYYIGREKRGCSSRDEERPEEVEKKVSPPSPDTLVDDQDDCGQTDVVCKRP